MKTNFYLNSKKTSKSLKAVFCYIRGIEPKKTIYLNSKIEVDPKDWNPKTQSLRKGAPNSFELNNRLDDISQLIQKEYLSFVKKTNFSYEGFKSHISNLFSPNFKTNDALESDNMPKLLQVYDEFCEDKSSSVAPLTVQKYKVIKSELIECCKLNKIDCDFDNLSLTFFDKLIRYYIQKKNLKNNSIAKKITTIKVFLNWACDRKYFSNLDYKKVKCLTYEPDIISLTDEELESIYNIDLSEFPNLDRTRDIFCFESYTGQRISDIIKFDINDIKDGIWTLRTKKTKDIIKVPVIPKAASILNKYLSKDEDFPQLSNKQLNRNLKVLGKLVELNSIVTRTRYQGSIAFEEKEPKRLFLTTHVARKAFVTICISNGIPAEVVMSITGHKDPKTFSRYIRISDQTKIDALNKVWG